MAEQDRTTTEDSGAKASNPGPVAPAQESAPPVKKAAARKAPAKKAPAKKAPAKKAPAARKAPAKKAPGEDTGEAPGCEGGPGRQEGPREGCGEAPGGDEGPREEGGHGEGPGSLRSRGTCQWSKARRRQADGQGGRGHCRRGCRLRDRRGAGRRRPHRRLPAPAVRVRLRHVAPCVERPLDAFADHRPGRTRVQPGLGHARRPVRPGQQGCPGPAPEGPRGPLGHPEPAPGDRPGLRPHLPHAALPRGRSRELGPGPDRGPAAVDGRLRPCPAAVARHAARGSSGRASRADRQAAPRDRRWPGRHDARSHGDRPRPRRAGPGSDAAGADGGAAGWCRLPGHGRRGRLIVPDEVGEGRHGLSAAHRGASPARPGRRGRGRHGRVEVHHPVPGDADVPDVPGDAWAVDQLPLHHPRRRRCPSSRPRPSPTA